MKYLKHRGLKVYLKVSDSKSMRVEIGYENDISVKDGMFYMESYSKEYFIKITSLEFNEAYETAKKEIEDFKIKTK